MSLYDPSYEDLVGTPEEILEDSLWLGVNHFRHHHHTEHGLKLWHSHADDETRTQVKLDRMPLEPVHDHETDPACRC